MIIDVMAVYFLKVLVLIGQVSDLMCVCGLHLLFYFMWIFFFFGISFSFNKSMLLLQVKS